MIVAHDGHAFPMVGDEVAQRGRRPVAVEGVAAIGQEHQRDAAGAQHPVHLRELRERVGKVFEHVARDDEILARVSER